jgi:hypothetical protein
MYCSETKSVTLLPRSDVRGPPKIAKPFCVERQAGRNIIPNLKIGNFFRK